MREAVIIVPTRLRIAIYIITNPLLEILLADKILSMCGFQICVGFGFGFGFEKKSVFGFGFGFGFQYKIISDNYNVKFLVF